MDSFVHSPFLPLVRSHSGRRPRSRRRARGLPGEVQIPRQAAVPHRDGTREGNRGTDQVPHQGEPLVILSSSRTLTRNEMH